MAVPTITGKCGKDGFPCFDGLSMSAGESNKIEQLRASLKAAKYLAKNTNETRQATMQSEATKVAAKRKHADALAEQSRILKEAEELWVQISTRRSFDSAYGSQPRVAALGIDREELFKMMTCAAQIAVSTQAASSSPQAASSSQQAALQNGGIQDSLSGINEKLKGLADFSKRAAQTMIDEDEDKVLKEAAAMYLRNPKNNDKVFGKAVETMIEDDRAQVLDAAATTMIEDYRAEVLEHAAKRMRLEEEEEEEEEETSSDEE